MSDATPDAFYPESTGGGMGKEEFNYYERICKDNFDGIRTEVKNQYTALTKDMKGLDDKMSKVKERVFNGLSSLPGEVAAIRKLLLSFLIALILGGGGGIAAFTWRMAVLEERVKTNAENYATIEQAALDRVDVLVGEYLKRISGKLDILEESNETDNTTSP